MTPEEQSFTEKLNAWQDGPGAPETALPLLEQAEALLAEKRGSRDLWHDFLNFTAVPAFMQALDDRASRYRWAEATFKAVDLSQYSLEDLFEYRVARQPRHTLFQDMAGGATVRWSYQVSRQRIRSIAGLFCRTEAEPRVALFASNSVKSAWCDLACLLHGILVTPLNIHFDAATLALIFDELAINIAVADTAERKERLLEVRRLVKQPFTLFTLEEAAASGAKDSDLMRQASRQDADGILAERQRRPLAEVCTVMFTSGSTGRPKGISFSLYNLVSKRFARGAALPAVGEDEVLLCYLPLFHTFGRYFEMLGAIYWHGTYVFPGNPSTETLLSLMSTVNPTGLISIPLRWVQIQDRCLDRMAKVPAAEEKVQEVRRVIGKRLHWGLSAAGYLAPSVFKFFNHHGVKLCSGFGMTEATGGITMTPPGEYKENSIGIPLPGVEARLSPEGELEIAGHYIARYLEDIPPGREVPVVASGAEQHWLPTGDLFRKDDEGHYQIVDRLKDIYKNNKGQTIAPQRVEKKFEGVPGIKRTFLVGDAREYNVLLIVPDRQDPVLDGFGVEESLREYYHQIVTNANQDLAPYERVVNFEVIDRDFQVEREEVTPKGSLRRKTIEENFKTEIDPLFQSKFVSLAFGEKTVRIPRWIYRDLGILEDVVEMTDTGLHDQRRERSLVLAPGQGPNRFRIGDLEYTLEGDLIDLGLMASQPALWLGNPSLVAFCPCKQGWDRPMGPFAWRVHLPERGATEQIFERVHTVRTRDPNLPLVNQQMIHALFDETPAAVRAVDHLGASLKESDKRLGRVIRRRLEALAWHPDFPVRSVAYRVLLLDEPDRDYGQVMPAFLESGLPFLDEESIHKIATANLERRRLEALRQRLFSYRTGMQFPVSETTRGQFMQIFKLLADFARYHPGFYNTARSELASWILVKDDPKLADAAEEICFQLSKDYEAELDQRIPRADEEEWDSKVVFGDELTSLEIKRLREVLYGTTFLHQSIMLAFDEPRFDLEMVPESGIWISRIQSRRRHMRYRASVNTYPGKHYDLQIIISRDVTRASVMDTIYWLMSLSTYPYGPPVLPRLGCCRFELNARSLVYRGDLSVWEKIREFAGSQHTRPQPGAAKRLRRLFVRALSTYFRGWRISGGRIVPGAVTPENIVVPDLDFRESATISSLTGWRPYENTLSLVAPMVRNFFSKTRAHYATCKFLKVNLIFAACVEDLGLEEGKAFLETLRQELETQEEPLLDDAFKASLDEYLERLEKIYIFPLALRNAIDRYNDWATVNPSATPKARKQLIDELTRLYRLDRYGEMARYHLYRFTYFSGSSESVLETFDRLLGRMFRNPQRSALQMIELSDLQSAIEDPKDREQFSRLIFPRARQLPEEVEVLAVGESENKHVMVKTAIEDRPGETYTVREPIEPAEIGRLYRIFFKEGYLKTVNEGDRFLLVIDSEEQIVGGLCYRFDGEDVVQLDGSVTTALLMGRGIGSALLEDFCTRMTNQGVRVVKTHFFLRSFYAPRGFQVDSKWGALVRFLDVSE